jgi:hypothetical protein
MTTISARDRVPLLAQVVQHMTDQVTVIGVHYNAEPVMVGNRVHGVNTRGAGESTEAWNAHLWEVK